MATIGVKGKTVDGGDFSPPVHMSWMTGASRWFYSRGDCYQEHKRNFATWEQWIGTGETKKENGNKYIDGIVYVSLNQIRPIDPVEIYIRWLQSGYSSQFPSSKEYPIPPEPHLLYTSTPSEVVGWPEDRGVIWGSALVELNAIDGGWFGTFAVRLTEPSFLDEPAPYNGWYKATGWGDELDGYKLKLEVTKTVEKVGDVFKFSKTFVGDVETTP